MIDNSKDAEDIGKTAFQQANVVEDYFSIANRAQVLTQLKEAVQSGVGLMVLTGDEGSGKTTLFRMLENQLPSSYKIVFFTEAVDSFEDVLRAVRIQLGLDARSMSDGGDFDWAVEQISELLQSESLDLLLIFEEAENIFLATLERIRKLLARIRTSGAGMHLLFSGEKTFLENCDQLSLCDFRSTDALHLELVPLSEVETTGYLNSCAAGISGSGTARIFAKEVVRAIYSQAKGNFRKTAILGKAAVKQADAGSSFMVLLESVDEGKACEDGEQKRSGTFLDSFLLWKLLAGHLPWIVAGAVCLVLLMLFFGSRDQEEEMDQFVMKTERIEAASAVQHEKPQVSEIKDPVTDMQPEQQAENKAEAMKAVIEPVVPQPSLPVVAEGQHRVTGPVTTDIAVQPGNETIAEADERVIDTTKERQGPIVQEMAKLKKVVLLRATPDLKRKLDVSTETVKKLMGQPIRAVAKKRTLSGGHHPAEKLYRERLLAGASWKNGAKVEMYTVQLMALASKTAESNLMKMLSQENYRQEAGNLYIFKKAAGSGHIFVFYGQYPNLEMARLVQKSLPKFLRDHQPYAVSIKDAMDKVGQ